MNRVTKDTVQVLLVEDNPGDAKLVSKCFASERREISFHFTFDGEEALDFLYRRDKYHSAVRPDLVVIDLNLPKVDGREVLSEMKNDPSLKTIPVIVLTSSESEEDVRQSYECGANCVLIKAADLEGVTSLFNIVSAFWIDTVKLMSPPRRTAAAV